MVRILIVEDEKPIADLIHISLTDAGYFCERAYNGMEAANRIERENFDLILLDIMLPEVDGYELMEYIRPTGIPVIFLTAKAGVLDKVKGLKLGADDYLVKPFEIIELLARVETVLRRYKLDQSHIRIEDLYIDTRARVVQKNGVAVNLTKKEFELLLLFIQNKNIALFRETIYKRVWDEDFMGDSRTLDLHVQRLRKKVGWEERITAVYKVGYRLEV